MSFRYNNRQGGGESRQVGTEWKVPTQYSCVYDPNNADGANETIDSNGNFSHKPDFAYPCPTDPNHPDHTYVTDPNSPGYINPNQCEDWYVAYQYNLSTDGNSAYSIDVADLLVFLDDSPWLWTACWRHDIEDYLEQVANSQSAMMLSAPLESQASSESLEIASVPSETALSSLSMAQSSVEESPAEESSVEEFDPAAEREQIVSLLEDITVFIDAGGEDAQAWQEIKDLLEQSLTELEEMAIETTEF
jgi:hypothetical protein